MALRFDPDALGGIPKNEAKRLLDKCEWLWANRKVLSHTLLRDDLNPFLKWRVGDYRIIYIYDSASDDMVVHLIGHRRDIYQRASRLKKP